LVGARRPSLGREPIRENARQRVVDLGQEVHGGTIAGWEQNENLFREVRGHALMIWNHIGRTPWI
jgi:hypothetical protein